MNKKIEKMIQEDVRTSGMSRADQDSVMVGRMLKKIDEIIEVVNKSVPPKK